MEERKRREMLQLKVKLPQKALPMRRSSGDSCYCAQAQAYVREMKRRDYPCPAFKPTASDSFRWSPNRWPVRSWQRKSTRCALLWLSSNCRCHKFTSYQKVIKKGSKHKGFVRNGLKDVQVSSHILLSFLICSKCSTIQWFFFSSLFWGEMELFSYIIFTPGTNSQRGNWSCDICWRCHSHWGLFRWALVGFWTFFL